MFDNLTMANLAKLDGYADNCMFFLSPSLV